MLASLPAALVDSIVAELGNPILKVQAQGGGDIHHACRIQTKDGWFFLKYNTHPSANAMLSTEADGLKELAQAKAIQIPAIIATGQAEAYAFLILEFIESGRRSPSFWESFGRQLAHLHQRPSMLEHC